MIATILLNPEMIGNHRFKTKSTTNRLAQVINGYDTDVHSVRRKVALDKQYIGNIGWRTDLRILMMTVRTVLEGEGAH